MTKKETEHERESSCKDNTTKEALQNRKEGLRGLVVVRVVLTPPPPALKTVTRDRGRQHIQNRLQKLRKEEQEQKRVVAVIVLPKRSCCKKEDQGKE